MGKLSISLIRTKLQTLGALITLQGLKKFTGQFPSFTEFILSPDSGMNIFEMISG